MAVVDAGMTDLDQLREGIHGGPLPPARRLAAIVGDAQRVVAIQAETLPAAPRGARWLRIHPGIGYLLWRGPSPLPRLRLPRQAVVGESQAIAGDLVRAVQQALVSLRRRELAGLVRRHGPPPDFARECEARAMLLAHLRGGAEWDAAWRWWSELVLLRHQYQVNAVRRKLVELLALATRDIDHDTSLSWPFRAYIDAVYATYALTALVAAARRRLGEIAPLLHRPRSGALPAVLASALGWAEARLGEAISLRHAAHAAGVAPEHLARLARRHLGRPFLVHLTMLRLGEARRRLATSDEPMHAIAAACGFGSGAHFQRTFKRVVGISPGAWRGEVRGAPDRAADGSVRIRRLSGHEAVGKTI